MASRYDEVLRAIAEGRELTREMVTGDPADRRRLLGNDFAQFQAEIEQTDTDKPGWIAKPLGGGS